MFPQHLHAASRHEDEARAYSIDKQHGISAWTCSMDTAWTFSLETPHRHTAWTCSMDKHEAWTIDMKHRQWKCSMDGDMAYRNGQATLVMQHVR